MSRVIELPCYGIRIQLDREHTAEMPGNGAITDRLPALACPRPAQSMQMGRYLDVVQASAVFDSALLGVLALILAHACTGVDVESPAYVEGIEMTVDRIVAGFKAYREGPCK